ncbi:MAG: endonuclease III [Armatimonadetes bacterium CG_4_10_14_3_um_filter_66_18]|nr:endonuclease III [Armatimonadota bacterium]OIP01075.1 MAG: endonuclease III [Armatimonadetes bacterium CG2_30_66_41]PIU92796.1 MAG: endonuclease III [Armatimonadetes bacterium CG06_land_8_20_14_3_00_66_21]PIW20905.1 MAG: endonuclease III [Armatimonadetes bacterium CG17_big_fil_post_rev_8_21_14_2_50_66_6]PIX39803.1 MAG: endonuclease III [Armatimonadetes bacterium CG_4_8_14_3_um_filter_66_20]PIY53654.1 MAG: endonuclease III [Armatimonadetes bacterium CG_4_10_14_3_um_filter_66_18]PIZ40934.1 M
MPRESKQSKQLRARAILDALRHRYPNPTTALEHGSPWELLVATILSAQCTDEKVNEVTRALFRKYPQTADYANAEAAEFQRDIYSTGFYQKKAKAVIETAQTVATHFGGELPDTMEAMLTLPGVARKTANVVLGVAFGKAAGVVVDTHVARLALRLGLTPRQTTKTTNTEKIENDLKQLLPQDQWIFAGLALIWHGRDTCDAKKPRCEECCLRAHCPRVGVGTK